MRTQLCGIEHLLLPWVVASGIGRRLGAIGERLLAEEESDSLELVRALGGGVWEVRSSLTRGRIARVLFCVEGNCMVLLHGFVKKTQKTSQRDIELALRRRKGDL